MEKYLVSYALCKAASSKYKCRAILTASCMPSSLNPSPAHCLPQPGLLGQQASAHPCHWPESSCRVAEATEGAGPCTQCRWKAPCTLPKARQITRGWSCTLCPCSGSSWLWPSCFIFSVISVPYRHFKLQYRHYKGFIYPRNKRYVYKKPSI